MNSPNPITPANALSNIEIRKGLAQIRRIVRSVPMAADEHDGCQAILAMVEALALKGLAVQLAPPISQIRPAVGQLGEDGKEKVNGARIPLSTEGGRCGYPPNHHNACGYCSRCQTYAAYGETGAP